MTDFNQNLIDGMKWLPIYKQALETHEEFERRNKKDLSYKMGLGEVIYCALVLFHDEIISYEGDSYDLIKSIRDEYISANESNMRFMAEFGALDKEFKSKINAESRYKHFKKD